MLSGASAKKLSEFLDIFQTFAAIEYPTGSRNLLEFESSPAPRWYFFIFVLDDTNWVQSDFKLAPDTDWTFRQYFISFAHNLDFLESQACHIISLSMVLNIYKFLSHFTTFLSMFIIKTPVNFPRTANGRNGLLGCDRCVLNYWHNWLFIQYTSRLEGIWLILSKIISSLWRSSPEKSTEVGQRVYYHRYLETKLQTRFWDDLALTSIQPQLHLLDLLEEKQLIDWKLERKYLTYSWCE